jgi:Flp pilus assembly protein TadG
VLVRCEKGAALVETALSATVLLALLMGMMQTFLALYGYHYVAYAAREGSRWAMVRGADCHLDGLTMTHCGAQQSDIQTYVRSLSFPGIDSNNVTVTAAWDSPSTPTTAAPTISWSTCSTGTPATGCNNPGHIVVVDVTYAFPLNIPFVSNRTLNMTSTSSMVISQ